jgi:predicted membrane GTPase involved in stress response
MNLLVLETTSETSLIAHVTMKTTFDEMLKHPCFQENQTVVERYGLNDIGASAAFHSCKKHCGDYEGVHINIVDRPPRGLRRRVERVLKWVDGFCCWWIP